MGMSMHVVGFRPPDSKWEIMKQIYDACRKAGIEPPDEVQEFFDYQAPDDAGVEIDVTVSEWRDDSREGFEVDINELPPDLNLIRFYCSW